MPELARSRLSDPVQDHRRGLSGSSRRRQSSVPWASSVPAAPARLEQDRQGQTEWAANPETGFQVSPTQSVCSPE